MAKRQAEQVQDDLFPEAPTIGGLAISGFRLKGGELSADMTGVANVNDVARLTDDAWRQGAARWLWGLCEGDYETAIGELLRIREEFERAERERLALEDAQRIARERMAEPGASVAPIRGAA